MKKSQIFAWAMPAVMLTAVTTTLAATPPKDSCSVLPLSQVRAVVTSPVVIYRPGSGSSVRGQNTISNCTYAIMDGNGHPTFGRNATLSLMWGPPASLAQINQFYEKRHKELSGIKGGVLVLASVKTVTRAGHTDDSVASKKLLDAALARL